MKVEDFYVQGRRGWVRLHGSRELEDLPSKAA